MSKLATSIVAGPFTFTDCSYDAETDIAYLSIDRPRPAICWESPEGHLVRLDPETDELVGITILHLMKRIEASGQMDITFPRHILVAAEGSPSPNARRPITLPRAELAALLG
jgi:uncharacterized protein YuzE